MNKWKAATIGLGLLLLISIFTHISTLNTAEEALELCRGGLQTCNESTAVLMERETKYDRALKECQAMGMLAPLFQ